ncbi:MAG: phage holin [Phycisphaerae bacterium]|nr:phage holin [Phycisphaerae bacterium]
MSRVPQFLRALVAPLGSRKVRVALATVLASYAAAYGFDVREEVIHTILAVGAALILGIAHEDTARPAANREP